MQYKIQERVYPQEENTLTRFSNIRKSYFLILKNFPLPYGEGNSDLL